ncbi:MAG: hypothetical protein CBB97_19785 [Candidatus Endolissoclinum sp. TMED37]|nr:MAG: hypothetical protein CBB97_19785 [Candidatus Endolissoclinum sp. TMED37]
MTNNYNINQFQFFTFITGLQNKEQELIKKLIKSFPYKDTHKINIIDKTEALRRKFINKEKIFHSERVYIVKDNMDFDFDLWEEFIKSNQIYINIIKEKSFDVHIKSVHKIMTEYLDVDFAVILDSDTKFINADYLPDVIKLLNTHNKNGDVAALGEIYQEAPFSLPFKSYLPQDFYRLILNEKRISYLQALKGAIRFYFSRMKPNDNDRVHKFPRLFTSLIAIEKSIYNNNNMLSKYLWLEVIKEHKKKWLSHRIMGDAGASLLYQISMAEKKIINIKYKKYISHTRSGSRPKSQKESNERNWLKFDYNI